MHREPVDPCTLIFRLTGDRLTGYANRTVFLPTHCGGGQDEAGVPWPLSEAPRPFSLFSFVRRSNTEPFTDGITFIVLRFWNRSTCGPPYVPGTTLCGCHRKKSIQHSKRLLVFIPELASLREFQRSGP